MGILALKRATAKAERLIAEQGHALHRIEMEIKEITGIRDLSVGELAGDGLGVFLNGEDTATPLNMVIALIEKNGSVCEDEIVSLGTL